MPGLSDDTDGSQEVNLPQSSNPMPPSTSAAHESFGPSSAMSPAPHESLMKQQHLPVMAPKPAPWEAPHQHLPGSCTAGIPRGMPQAQSGYFGQHADAYTEAPPSDHMHHVLQCTSPVSHPLPSQVLQAAPPLSSVSNASGHASPAPQRRRAAKSVHMRDNTPLAACEVPPSTARLPGITMMTVPDRPQGRPPIKLSPLKGLSVSPVAPASAQWPAAAGHMHQHAEPPMVSPGRPAEHVPAYAIHGSSRHAEAAVKTGNVPVGQLQNPFQPGSSLASSPGRFREYARENGLGCAASEDAAELLIQQASEHQMSHDMGLTDDQFQPPRPGTSFCDLLAVTSSQSMQGAEAAGAHYTDQLRQQRLQVHPESQILGESAIDLCEDEAMLEPATAAETQQRQAQISSDERMARELDMAGRPGVRQQNVSSLICIVLDPCNHTCHLQFAQQPLCLSICPKCPCCLWPFHSDITASCIATTFLPGPCMWNKCLLSLRSHIQQISRMQCRCRTLEKRMTATRIGS